MTVVFALGAKPLCGIVGVKKRIIMKNYGGGDTTRSAFSLDPCQCIPPEGKEEGGRSREDSDATVFQWWSGCYQQSRGVWDHLEREPIIPPDMDGLNDLNRWMESGGCRSGFEQWP